MKARGFRNDSASARPDNGSSVNQTIARRYRLAEAVDRLSQDADEAAGYTHDELRIVADFCYEHGLIAEAFHVLLKR